METNRPKKIKYPENLHVRLSTELVDKLSKLSDKLGMRESELVRKLISDAYDKSHT